METIHQTIKYEKGKIGYVEGLYDSIDVLHKPNGFDFVDEILEQSNYGKQVTTEFYNSNGYFIRNFDKVKKIFTFNHGFLQDLPKWVTDVKKALVEGKGIPTQAYFTLRQMKLLGIAKGEIQIVKMAQIQNLETMGYIYKTMKEKGFTKLSEVDILAAPSNEYMKTVMTQAGYQLRTGEIIEKGKYFTVNELKNEGFNITKEYMNKYGLTNSSKLYIDFDILVKVKYIK